MTRWGMKEDDFRELARIMRMLLIDKKDVEEMRRKVIEFRKQFNKIHYTFELPLDAFKVTEKLPLLW